MKKVIAQSNEELYKAAQEVDRIVEDVRSGKDTTYKDPEQVYELAYNTLRGIVAILLERQKECSE